MVNTTDFGKRIQQIMEYYALSASGFADVMGVGRSSISHILSGRNKPSLDFVMKIVESYHEAELHWLLYGEGTFPKSKKVLLEPIDTPEPVIDIETTPTMDVTDVNKVAQNLFSQSPIPKTNTLPKDIEEEPVSTTITPSVAKEIHQIVIFYKDGTFDAFKN